TLICRRCRKRFPGGAWGLGTVFVLLAASHGFFDALTDGGLGIGFLSPFSNRRYFLLWSPIPVVQLSPLYYFRYPSLIAGLMVEAAMFWPVSLALPVLRSRLKRPWNVLTACVLAAVSIAAWVARI
ncbi:MAG: hypothetical protein QGI33_03365, partial [Candidatus Brocadiia bacterium]|nr:hypothetical protein [Candidatus Brocadiia bacterium]